EPTPGATYAGQTDVAGPGAQLEDGPLRQLRQEVSSPRRLLVGPLARLEQTVVGRQVQTPEREVDPGHQPSPFAARTLWVPSHHGARPLMPQAHTATTGRVTSCSRPSTPRTMSAPRTRIGPSGQG